MKICQRNPVYLNKIPNDSEIQYNYKKEPVISLNLDDNEVNCTKKF